MEKKRFYKVIRAFKHNGEIREFPFTLPYTFDEAYALAVDSTDYSVWDLIALVPVEPMRSIVENGIKAIDLAIKEFENDYHHRDIDAVGLERSKEL